MSSQPRPCDDYRPDEAALQEMVAEVDTGARHPSGAAGQILLWTAIAWSLFQLWYASPLPFVFNVFVLNDTEARSIHLAFALFLAFTAYPALRRSPRDHIPLQDWVMALLGAFASLYLYLFYDALSSRPGSPTTFDLVIAVIGMVLLLEATRRSLGPPLMVVALVFLAYVFLGPIRARRARLPGRFAEQGDVAHVADHRGRVRHRARRLDQLRVPVRAVQRAVGQGRRRRLLHPARLRPARAHAGRPRQSLGRVVGAERRRLRLLDRQRRDRRRVHDLADEAGRLHAGPGGRDRDLLLGQRPADAAGHGRRRLPDGRVHRHPLQPGGHARRAAGGDLLHRALLHRPSRGDEARPAADSEIRAGAHLAGPADGRAARLRRHRGGLRGGLLWRAPAQAAVRRLGLLGLHAAAPDRLRRAGRLRGALSRPAGGGPRQADRGAARARAHVQGRAALPPAGGRAGLVPDRRAALARPVRLLRHGADDRHRGDAKAVVRACSAARPTTAGRGATACSTCATASRSARAT